MPVTAAAPADLPAVKAFVRTATRRQMGLGDEDLASLVEGENVLLVVGPRAATPLGRDQIEALAAFYPEPRPVSLPTEDPDRVFLRAAVFRNGASPSTTLHELLDAWCRRPARRPRLLIAYGGEPWYNRALQAGGCTLAQEVIFFELANLDRDEIRQASGGAATPGPATLRTATIGDIGELALLDAACFDVLWHMGPADLRQLLLFGRLTVATIAGGLAGYLAITMRDEVAQVARLAVHPTWTGHGIGRQLLLEGLQAAEETGCRRAVLNTQSNNERAQALYRTLGFHPTGERFEVYTRQASGV
jgi:ribosomal protein S18 acetylase RimI-like enzyme